MKLTTFFLTLLIGLLAVTTVFFYAGYQITKAEYHDYRNGIFTRAYESVLADLAAYLRDGDEAVAPQIVARLSELPLSDGEVEIIRLLARDMTAGAYEEEARDRATTYAEALFRYLSAHRTQVYTESWRAAGMGLPAYPGEDIPVAALPEAEPDWAAIRKEKAAVFLRNRSLIAYTREEGGIPLYGYRTASSYVEMTEAGRLVRMLRRPKGEDGFFSEAECRSAAESFLQGLERGVSLLTAEQATEGGYLFYFRDKGGQMAVGVSAGSGEVYSFWGE